MASPLGPPLKRPPGGVSPLGPPLKRPPGRVSPAARSLSTLSQDGSASDRPEKRLRPDPARVAFEKQLRSQAAALVEAQTNNTRLQTKLQSVEAQHREAQLKYETERQELTRRTERAERQAVEAASDLQRERRGRAALEAELAARSARLESARTEADRERRVAERRAEEEGARLAEELSEARQQLTAARSSLAEAEAECQETQLQLDQERAQSAAALERAESAADSGLKVEELKLELSTERLRVKELENELACSAEDVRLGALMRQKLARYSELEQQHAAMEAELRSLRHVVDRTLVLEEQASVLQQRADRCDRLQTELETARAECSEWRLQVATWREAAGDGVTAPDDLSRALDELRRQQLLLRESGGAARAELSAAESRCQTLQTELDRLKSAQAEHDQSKLEGQVQLRKLQRKLTLVTMERDSSKRVLDAYESETTASLTSIERQRCEDQHRQLAAYRQQVDALERQLQEAASSGKLVFGSADSEARAELSSLRAEHESLRQRQESLLQEKEGLEAQLEERALRGDYNPATSRVLALRDNPTASATSRRAGQLERLQRENTELRGRLEVMGDGQPGLSQDAAKQISGLRSDLRASELRLRRLKEVFTRSTQEYRQSVCQLTGYKISADGAQLRLRSVYAPQADHQLLFQRGADESIQLLENAFSARLADLVEQYLYRRDSMPGFLAALTLKLMSDGAAAPARTTPAPAARAAAAPARAAPARAAMARTAAARPAAAARAPVRPPPPDDDSDDCEIVELD